MVQVLTKPRSPVSPRRPEIAGLYVHRQGLGEPNLDEQLGTVAHELRSPLVSILFGVYAIPDQCDVGSLAQRTLTNIEHQLWQAMRLVDDLIDLCAGNLGKLSIHKEVVALADVVARATEMAGRSIAARQHQLSVSLPPEPLYLDADPLRLAQVLTILLGNAAKFTDPGGHIRLSAAVEHGQIVICVRDNGRGIPFHLLPRVFDLFQQAPGGRVKGSMGIGLALVKSLVELHGGSVAARSDGPGTGSAFLVYLPMNC